MTDREMTQGKPRWEDSPKWAMWGAIGWNGWRLWFEHKPGFDGGKYWLTPSGRVESGRRVCNYCSGVLSTLEPRPTADDGAVTDVIDLMNRHKDTWRDMPEAYWFQRLAGELGELGCALANDHEHPPDWELKQIAAICLNWLDMRLALTPVKPEPAPLLCPYCKSEMFVFENAAGKIIFTHQAKMLPGDCVVRESEMDADNIEDAEARLRGES